jgi:DNA modification methylase
MHKFTQQESPAFRQGRFNKILQGDCLEQLKTLPAQCVNTVVTSPPYFNLRSYLPESHKEKYLEIGIEKTLEEYVQKLIECFREVKRVLRDDGTVWLNLGDSYCNSNGFHRAQSDYQRKGRNDMSANDRNLDELHASGLKTKDLIGIPWMTAFALRADGWYLRQDIIWQKPNPMPESVNDRCTKSHEYIFLLSKNSKYYFDNEAIKEKCTSTDDSIRNRDASKLNSTPGRTRMGGLTTNLYEYKNKRDVWNISTKPYKEAHFASFPEELIIPCILAGCPIGGVVLDPFFGSGTTGAVAKEYGRNYIGIELNPEYIEMAKRRIAAVNPPLPI